MPREAPKALERSNTLLILELTIKTHTREVTFMTKSSQRQPPSNPTGTSFFIEALATNISARE